MMLIENPSIIREGLPYYANNYSWNLLHAHIDAHSQRVIDEYPEDGL